MSIKGIRFILSFPFMAVAALFEWTSLKISGSKTYDGYMLRLENHDRRVENIK